MTADLIARARALLAKRTPDKWRVSDALITELCEALERLDRWDARQFEIERLRSEVKILQAVASDRSQAHERADEAQEERNQYRDSAADLLRQLMDTRKERDEARAEIELNGKIDEEFRAEIERLTRWVAELRAEIERLRQRLAEVMGCTSAGADLVEVAQLLVEERDEARSEIELAEERAAFAGAGAERLRALLDEARAEIERLRSDLEIGAQARRVLVSANMDMTAEVDRLRAALERHGTHDDDTCYRGPCTCGFAAALEPTDGR